MRPTATEAHVLVRAAEDVELERAVELILVAVRGDVPDADLVAILELLAAQNRVARDVAPEVHDRRCPPDDLVGRRLRARRIVDQQLVLLGKVAECLDAMRDRIARSLASSVSARVSRVWGARPRNVWWRARQETNGRATAGGH